MYDNLVFRQLIEDEFNLKKNTLSEQQADLLIKKLDEQEIYLKCVQINENFMLTGNSEDNINALSDINRKIYLLLSDVGVDDSDYDNNKLVFAFEGLDFSKMTSLLNAIKNKVNADKKK